MKWCSKGDSKFPDPLVGGGLLALVFEGVSWMGALAASDVAGCRFAPGLMADIVVWSFQTG